MRKNIFNKSINNDKAYLNGFNGANIKRLDHFIIPILNKDQLDIVITHVGCTNIIHGNIDKINFKDDNDNDQDKSELLHIIIGKYKVTSKTLGGSQAINNNRSKRQSGTEDASPLTSHKIDTKEKLRIKTITRAG